MLKKFLLLILMTVFASCGDDKPKMILFSDEIASISLTPGYHNINLNATDGFTRQLCIWVPAAADSHDVPLVLALHWAANQSLFRSEPYLRYFARPSLEQLNAIIIAPDLPADNWQESRTEDYVISLLTIIKEVWPVDPHRIIVTGYSLGGIGTWHFADKYPELFCAAIPVASQPVGFLTGKVPHYIIQGMRDESFGYIDVQTAYDVMKSKKRNVRLKLVDLSHSQTSAYIIHVQESIEWINSLH